MKKTMLHVNNVCWIGGTMFATWDMCKAYPDFKHYVCYHNSHEVYKVLKMMMNDGITMSCVPSITKKIVERIDPCVIFFNNTVENQVEGEWPYDWLKKWTVIAIHHNPTYPLFQVDLDCFVSQNVLDKYQAIKDRMKKIVMMPPCIQTSRYTKINRETKINKKKIMIGKVSNDNKKKFPNDLIDIFEEVQNKSDKELQFCIIGGEKYYQDAASRLKNLIMPEVGSIEIERLYANIDILVYKTNVIESWGRVITEAMASGLSVVAENKGGIKEQIKHKKNGFLCDTNEQFVSYTLKLIQDNQLRYDIGMAARMKAVNSFDIKVLKEKTVGTILSEVLGAS